MVKEHGRIFDITYHSVQQAMLDRNVVCCLTEFAFSRPEAAGYEISTSRKVFYSAGIIMLISAKNATDSWICTECWL